MTLLHPLTGRSSNRPVYGLFQHLLSVQIASEDNPIEELSAAGLKQMDGEVLKDIAECASTLQRCLHLGTAAVGRCLALAAPDAMDGDQCSPGTVEAIGWLLAELADLSTVCHHLEATTRRIRHSQEKESKK